MKLDKKNHANKVFGILKKITLDKDTHSLKKFNNNETLNKNILQDCYFELNLYEMTLSYKSKLSDKVLKRYFGYKQVYQFTLKLNREEEALASGEFKLGFKLLLENKVFLLFCRSVFDLKMWMDAFKIFFDKKSTIIKLLNKKIRQENEKRAKFYVEEWKYIERYLMSFSESFIAYTNENKVVDPFHKLKINIKETRIKKRRLHSYDKIFIRYKTSSSLQAFSYFNSQNQYPILYKSKMLRKLTNDIIYCPENFTKYKDKKIDSSKLRNFINNLMLYNSNFFSSNTLRVFMKEIRTFHKLLKEHKLMLKFAVQKKEMEDEWEFFMEEDKVKYSNTETIDRDKLKDQVILLGKEKSLKQNKQTANLKLDFTGDKNNSETHQSKMTVKEIEINTGNTPADDDKCDNSIDFNIIETNINIYRQRIIFENENDYKLNKPKFTEDFQNFGKQNVLIEQIHDKIKLPNSNIESQQDNENYYNQENVTKPYKSKLNNKSKPQLNKINTELLVNENLKVIYKDKDDFFIFEMKEKEEGKMSQRNIPDKVFSVFPERNKKSDIEHEYNYQEPHSIDNLHFKPKLSLSINEDDEVQNHSSIILNEKKSFSVVDSPHFSNISIMAQRYNKIDRIDDWKDYIDI